MTSQNDLAVELSNLAEGQIDGLGGEDGGACDRARMRVILDELDGLDGLGGASASPLVRLVNALGAFLMSGRAAELPPGKLTALERASVALRSETTEEERSQLCGS